MHRPGYSVLKEGGGLHRTPLPVALPSFCHERSHVLLSLEILLIREVEHTGLDC